jgi:hypothetical protein
MTDASSTRALGTDRTATTTALGRLVARLLVRPDLWPAALRAGWSLAARGWWRRWPFLPLPDSGWTRFRLTAAYGSAGELVPDDVVTWLEWRRCFPR